MEPAFILDPVTDRAEFKSALLGELFDRWQSLAVDGLLPLTAVNLEELGPARGYIWWFDVLDGGADFFARLFEWEAVKIYGFDIHGKTLVSQTHLPTLARTLKLLRSSIQQRRAIRFFSEMSVVPNRQFYYIEGLCFPVSRTGATVDALIGASAVRYL